MALVSLATVVALAAAARSTWSPCGLSMLSTVTPLAERARGHRFAVTAAWFVAGGVLGGATLGLGAAALALGVDALGVPSTARWGAAAAAAAAAALVDAGALGRTPPFLRRQVDDGWLAAYRGWVYGLGFGWQIGVGLATYIMTSGVALAVLLAALTGSPLAAFGVAVLFGTARGLVVLLGAAVRSPEALARLHRRLAALDAPSARAATGVWAATGAVAAAAAWGPWGAAAGVVVTCALVLALRLPLGLRTRPSS